MRSLLLPLWNLLFPNFCAFCESPLRSTLDLCADCQHKQQALKYPQRNFPTLLKLLQNPDSATNLQRACALYYFVKQSPVQSLVHQMKYEGNLALAHTWGKQIAGFFTDAKLNALIPIPLHPLKYKQRGYNQSAEIARAISNHMGIPVLNKIVKRVKYTDSQSVDNKDFQQRAENIAGAFELDAYQSAEANLADSHILLVDDVITTGATMRELIAVLIRHYPKIKLSVAAVAATEGIMSEPAIISQFQANRF